MNNYPELDPRAHLKPNVKMIEKKIKIPLGMIEAVKSEHRQRGFSLLSDTYIACILSAALKWLMENPLLPNAEQEQELYVDKFGCNVPARILLVKWQQRMFLEPEPDPDEEISDLFWSTGVAGKENMLRALAHDDEIRVAFRRGKESSYAFPKRTDSNRT